MTDKRPEIRTISGTAILGEFDYRIAYSTSADDSRMRLIYAPNGRGKTNFLRAVDATINSTPESLQDLMDIPFQSLTVTFADASEISIMRERMLTGAFTACATVGESDISATIAVDPTAGPSRFLRRLWETKEEFTNYSKVVEQISSGSTYIGDARLTAPTDDTREAPRGHRAPSDTHGSSITILLDDVERMLTQAALQGMARENSPTGIYTEITRTTLHGSPKITSTDARLELLDQLQYILKSGAPLESYGLLSLRQVRAIESQISDARANSRHLPSVHAILKPYLDSQEDQIGKLAPAYDLINTYVTSVNSFLDRKELAYSPSRGITLIGRNAAHLAPESLSSGERHLLLLISQALLANASSPLLIIDEPEISLGIEWQRSLLPELARCTTTGSVQFLIASHSLQVMNTIPREEIVVPKEVK